MGDIVLVADDQAEVRAWVRELLREHGRTPVETAEAERVAPMVAELGDSLSLVILDLDFGSGKMDGMSALRAVREQGNEVPVLILTGKGSVRAAVDAVKAGATDFIEKDAHVDDALAAALSRLQRYAGVLAENKRLRAKLAEQTVIVGSSPVVAEVMRQIARVAAVPRPVLIVGERGTGKELVAYALHHGSPRASGPFVTVNCAAIPEGLLECELFGQVANAYDGAPFKEGRFDLANGGTLFLDEIGNMGHDFQRKILRVIEYQRFERVQGTDTIQVNVRIIAATNADISAAIADGRFRADLYDRLAFDVIHVPPLRDRLEDVRPLAEHFARRFHEEVSWVPPLRFSEEAIGEMAHHEWPGNVRELKSFVERLATRASRATVSASDVRDLLGVRAGSRGASAGADQPASTGDFTTDVAHFEARLLGHALEECAGNRRKAAEVLGLSYDQLRRLLAKHELG